jgi:hypothetical protein
MKNAPYFLLFIALTLLSSCGKDNNIEPTGVNEIIVDQIDYSLSAVNGSGISGKATLTRDSNDNTTILIELQNTTTKEHPAFVRFGSAAEGGSTIAITLEVCECAVGTTVVTRLDDGTPVDFDKLLNLDGHVSIGESSVNPNMVVSVADIGTNAN